MNGTLANIGLVVVFVLVGSMFAAAEIALVSLRDGQVRAMAEPRPARRGGRPPGRRPQPLPRGRPGRRHAGGLPVGVLRRRDPGRRPGPAAGRPRPARRRRRRRRAGARDDRHLLRLPGAGRARPQAAGPAARGGLRAGARSHGRPDRHHLAPGHLAAVGLHQRRGPARRRRPQRQERADVRRGAARARQHPRDAGGGGAPHRRGRLRGRRPADPRGDDPAHRGRLPGRARRRSSRPPRRRCGSRTRATP